MIPLDQPTRLTFRTYSDAAKTTPADPTTVSLSVKDWTTGAVTTYTWAAAQVTRDSAGVFHWDAPDTTAKTLQYRWVATGAVATSTKAGLLTIGAAFPDALVSLEDAKVALNKTVTTDDDELQDLIYSASSILLGLPGYRIADVCAVQEYTEDFTPSGDEIAVDHYPIIGTPEVTEWSGGTSYAVTAEPVGTTTFADRGFRVKAAAGIIKRTSSGYPTPWQGDVLVVYTAGTGTVPLDVRDATLKLVKHLWDDQRGAGSQPFDTSGDEFRAPITAHLLPWEVEEALQPYRRAPAVA